MTVTARHVDRRAVALRDALSDAGRNEAVVVAGNDQHRAPVRTHPFGVDFYAAKAHLASGASAVRHESRERGLLLVLRNPVEYQLTHVGPAGHHSLRSE